MGTSKRAPRIEQDVSAFARSVRTLYLKALKGEASKEADVEVREVAFGLAALRQLLNLNIRDLLRRHDLNVYASTGVLQAEKILDALISGHAHPVWWFLKGVQSIDRPQRTWPTTAEQLVRMILVGLARAYEREAGVSHKAAIRAVIKACSFNDQTFTVGQIIGWDQRLAEQQKIEPAAVADDLIKQAIQLNNSQPLAERILLVGQRYIYTLGGTPSPHLPSQ
jgi:hypothetical protein